MPHRFESSLPQVLESFNETVRGVSGRITAQKMKEQVLTVLRIWEAWSLYPPQFLNGLRATFLMVPKDANEKEEQAPAAPAPAPPVDDDDIDGTPSMFLCGRGICAYLLQCLMRQHLTNYHPSLYVANLHSSSRDCAECMDYLKEHPMR